MNLLRYVSSIFLWFLLCWGMGFAQPASDPNFSERLSKVAPEFEWLSTDEVRDEAQDIWKKYKNELGYWAIRISEMHGLASALKTAHLPASLMYVPVALAFSGDVLTLDLDRNGAWKQYASVAAKYGLKTSPWIDQRLDPELSARAAVRQLDEVWSEFTPSSLALLAFLSSPAQVRQAQYRSCDAKSCRSVLELMDSATLRVYHRFLALIYLYSYHRELLPAAALSPPNKPPFFIAKSALPMGFLIDENKLDSVGFRRQNPHLIGDVIPAGIPVYGLETVRLQGDHSERLQVYGFQRLKASSDSIVNLLLQLKEEPEVWFELNGLQFVLGKNEVAMLLPFSKRPNPIQVVEPEIPSAPPTREPQQPKPVAKKGATYYKVKSGDTLWSIARKYPGVSHIDIQKANRLGDAGRIQPGQKLKIPY